MLFSNYFKRSDGIDDVTIYIESDKDLTRIPIWEFHHAKFDFWERGQVEIPKFEDYRVSVPICIPVQNNLYSYFFPVILPMLEKT